MSDKAKFENHFPVGKISCFNFHTFKSDSTDLIAAGKNKRETLNRMLIMAPAFS